MKQEWLNWASLQVDRLKDGGYLIYPLDGKGVVFRLDKEVKQLFTLCEHPEYHDSYTDCCNHEVFEAIGYSVIRPDDVPTNIEEVSARIKAECGFFAITDELVLGLSEIFKVPTNTIGDMLHKASGNKEPINPVTIREKQNAVNSQRALAIGRLWLGNSDTLVKTMQFVIFKENANSLETLAFAVADENDFLKYIKCLQVGTITEFKIIGTVTAGSIEKRIVHFNRVSSKIYVNILSSCELKSYVRLECEKFNEALSHLFVRGELTVGNN